MPEHFSKSTTEAMVWCKPCVKPTMHTVWDGRRGSCMECIKKREQEAVDGTQKKPPQAVQESLF